MKNKIVGVVIAAFILFTGFAVLLPATTSAAVAAECNGSTSFLSIPTWYKYLDVGRKDEDKCAIIGPPVGGEFSWELALPRIGLAIVDILLRVAGMVAVGYVIYGGFRYIVSQGEPDATKSAQGTVINALIGLAIALVAVVAVNFIGNSLWS